MSNKFRLLALFVVAYLFGPSWAPAAILYNESISGDLAYNSPIVFNLAAGDNSVLGSSGFTDSFYDFDGFLVNLGAGLRLDSIDHFIINRSVIGGTTYLHDLFYMKSGGHFGTLLAQTDIDLLGATQQSMFSGALPVSGVFSFATDLQSLSKSGPGGTWDYEIRFRVSVIEPESEAVPEPTTLAIWGGLGIAGLVAARRRKKLAA